MDSTLPAHRTFAFGRPARSRPGLALHAAAAVLALAVLAPGARAASHSAGAGADAPPTETAIFAGGCFWCVESDFDGVPGVVSTTSGYTGGTTENPTYEQVTHGDTGHREAVRIEFDPAKVSYAQLVEIFWRSVDPTDRGGQFCDRGHSYTTAIYATSDEQHRIALASKEALRASNRFSDTEEVVTPVERAGPFYPAEDYHQDYYEKNPLRYQFYRFGCGRDGRLKAVWGEEAMKGIEKQH